MTRRTTNWACLLIVVLLTARPWCADARAADAPDAARQDAERDPDVRAALRDFEEADAKARALYERQRAAGRQVAVKRLQARQERAAKSGNLDLAMAIRDLIDALRPGATTARSPSPTGLGGLEPPSQGPAAAAAYVGTWRYDNGGLLMLLADGRFLASGGPGRWEATEGGLVARYDGGIVVHTFKDRQPDRMAGHDQDGRDLVMTRMPLVPPDANGHPCLPPDELVGSWAEDNGKRIVLAPNGLFAYDGKAAGYWQATAEAVVLHFHVGRIDTYTKLAGNRLSGTSTDVNKHIVAITRQPGR